MSNAEAQGIESYPRVVRSGAEPDLAAIECSGAPDADMMSFSNGVERFFESHIRRFALIEHFRNWGGEVVLLAVECQVDMGTRAESSPVGGVPAGSVEGIDQLL